MTYIKVDLVQLEDISNKAIVLKTIDVKITELRKMPLVPSR